MQSERQILNFLRSTDIIPVCERLRGTTIFLSPFMRAYVRHLQAVVAR